MEEIVSIGLIISYVLVALAVLSAIVMPLISAFKNPRVLAFSLGGVGIILVIFLIGYAMAGDEVTAGYIKYGVDSTISKIIGGALITMYIVGILAVVGILFTEFNKMLR